MISSMMDRDDETGGETEDVLDNFPDGRSYLGDGTNIRLLA